jgi:hypothetical protein
LDFSLSKNGGVQTGVGLLLLTDFSGVLGLLPETCLYFLGMLEPPLFHKSMKKNYSIPHVTILFLSNFSFHFNCASILPFVQNLNSDHSVSLLDMRG